MGRRFEPFVAQETGSDLSESVFLFENLLFNDNFFVIFGLTRGVAQPGRASALGAECHQFESGYPDTQKASLAEALCVSLGNQISFTEGEALLHQFLIRDPLPYGFFGASRKNLFFILFLEPFVVGE